MGKAADNERIKIQASFYNGCAIAICVAGIALPMLGLFAYLPELAKPDYSPPDLWKIVVVGASMFAAFGIGAALHSAANRVLGDLQD
jgi:hypothetical protein